MKHVGLLEAQTQLSALVDEVASGGEVTIMRDGKPVARLVRAQAELAPAPEYTAEEIEKRRGAIARLREMAKERGTNFSHDEIKSWIEDGRHSSWSMLRCSSPGC